MSDRSDSPLFESFALDDLELSNRVVMAPMTRSRSRGGVPAPFVADYYAQRAGAGLIVTEGIAPAPEGLGYPRIPGLWSEAQVEGWTAVTEAVHAAGGKIFAQFMHTGRVSHPANLPKGARVVAPSPVALEDTEMWVDGEGMLEIPEPEALSADGVEAAIDYYVLAAKNAIRAGFDGVELHGANGYLIEQFIHPHTNRREDEWGGSVEARLRFPIEVARRVADAIGASRVGMRLSPYGVFNEMPLYDEIDESYETLARELGEIGLVYLHILDHSDQGAPEVPTSIKTSIRDAFGGTILLAGGYDFERADAHLQEGLGHLVAFGRPFISNPDLVERLRLDAELADPDPSTFYTGGEGGLENGYTDYPTLETATQTT